MQRIDPISPIETGQQPAQLSAAGASAHGPVALAQVMPWGGRPTVFINGQPTFFACHYLRHYHRQWRDGLRQSILAFNEQGIHRFELHVDSGWAGEDGFDPQQRSWCYPLGPVLELIAAVDARAQLLLRIGADMTPQSWKDSHPDELERDHTGRPYEQSFASDLGFAALAGAFSRAVSFVEASPWAGHVVGYNIYLQFEGVPLGSGTEGAFTDYSPAMLRRWRLWLRQKYGSDAALACAWGDPAAVLDLAQLPTPAEHLGPTPHFLFNHPITGRKARDYYELMDQLTIDRHRQIAVAVAGAAPRKLIGMMGGYSQDAGEPRSIVAADGFKPVMLHKQHFSGPGPWGRAFEIPEIDFYFSCTDYLNTGMGGNCLALTMPASLALRGKACMIEDDLRTHLHRERHFNTALADAAATAQAHRRNAALVYTEAGISSWMEQAGNWLIDPPVLENLGRLQHLLEASVEAPALLGGGICVLFDEESQGWTKPLTYLDEELFYQQRNFGLSYCGVPVRYHLLSDLAKDGFPSYQLFVLPNAYHWTAEKERLLDRIRCDGNVLLWIYAPSYVGESELSAAGMSRAVGMALAVDDASWEHRVGITDFTHPITGNLPGDLVYGSTRHYGPFFQVVDPEVQILGRSFGLVMSRTVGLAIKEFGRGARGRRAGAGQALGPGDYASVYSEAPNLPACLLRELARYAGAHVYLESNDFLVAGGDLVMVHSAKPGPRTLQLPRPLQVLDAFSAATIAVAGAVSFALEAAGTRLFRVRPVEGENK